jgi:Helix-turn-helix domain
VSFDHQEAIRLVELAPGPKAVLTWAAWHACKGCGIAFAGVPLLARETGLSDSTVRRALEDLAQRGLILPIAYQTGGRGRATEYLVAPLLVSLPRGRCKTCGKYTGTRQTLSPRQGIGGETLSPRQGFGENTLSRGSQYPVTQDVNPVMVTPQQSVTLTVKQTGGPSASRPGSATPPISDATTPDQPSHQAVPPQTPEDDTASAEAFMREILSAASPDKPHGHPRKP